MAFAPEICPWLINLKRLVKRHPRKLCRDTLDLGRRHTAGVRHRFGRVFRIKITFRHQLHHGAMRDTCMAMVCGQIRLYPGLVKRRQLAGYAVHHQRFAIFVPQKQTVLG